MLKSAIIYRNIPSNNIIRGTSNSSSYIKTRVAKWDEEEARQLKKPKENKTITINLDGQKISGIAGVTTPHFVAQSVKHPLTKSSLVAEVNGALHDLHFPINNDAEIKLMTFDSSDLAKLVFWHSSSHILGQALEQYYDQIYLCDGPPLSMTHAAGTFFYEFQHVNSSNHVLETHYTPITQLCEKIVEQNEHFKKLIVNKDFAKELFSYNPLKLALLNKIDPSAQISLYRIGNFIDLCSGPHIPSTGMVKAIQVTQASSAQWNNNTLDRVYGVSFPNQKILKNWHTTREEASKRDHRVIGSKQNLFMFHKFSPGSPFFLPSGTKIYNKLIEFLRKKYVEYGYQEVISPLIFHNDIWKMSGHWQHYKENMFIVSTAVEEKKSEALDQMEYGPGHHHLSEDMALKPMNCPGHCLIFGRISPSYRDLPLKLADFSSLHRNESTGSLRGLTRVRRFVIDDAHIFCMPSQISTVIQECLEFVKTVYGALGFSYKIGLSTRPESSMGTDEQWSNAENALKNALKDANLEYSLNPGDGAFYGPKIDILIQDALKRDHQCATIQLDFQLPLRFELSYMAEDGSSQTPVIIHRAILGSLERMIAVLVEHTGGRFPFWLSPNQIIVCSLSHEAESYANEVYQQLRKENYNVKLNVDGETIEKKIRDAQNAQFNFILVIGKKEVEAKKVNVRTREGEQRGMKDLSEFISHIKELEQNNK